MRQNMSKPPCLLALSASQERKETERPKLRASIEHCRKRFVLCSATPPSSDVKAQQAHRGHGEQK